MDGYDDDALVRTLAVNTLLLHSTEAIEEWHQAIREMPMIEMRLKMEEQRAEGDPRRNAAALSHPPPPNQGLQLTHITKDTMTGQLNIRKEEIRSQVFRPGWNQPTMSLEELGERCERPWHERNAKVAEAQQKNDPRRYDQLVKDEMEDNAELVDASAALDRAWDDWRAENPKGVETNG
ncbi:Immunoglobulin-binding protein [Fragilaria crotonensis]|nr:Immunoglobulin-binding protein [Fragilaria crotonensis]